MITCAGAESAETSRHVRQTKQRRRRFAALIPWSQGRQKRLNETDGTISSYLTELDASSKSTNDPRALRPWLLLPTLLVKVHRVLDVRCWMLDVLPALPPSPFKVQRFKVQGQPARSRPCGIGCSPRPLHFAWQQTCSMSAGGLSRRSAWNGVADVLHLIALRPKALHL